MIKQKLNAAMYNSVSTADNAEKCYFSFFQYVILVLFYIVCPHTQVHRVLQKIPIQIISYKIIFKLGQKKTILILDILFRHFQNKWVDCPSNCNTVYKYDYAYINWRVQMTFITVCTDNIIVWTS